jgi:hypothetical protein
MSIVSGVLSVMNGKENADEVLVVADDEALDAVEVVEDVDAVVEVEEEDDDVVDALEEIGVVLVVGLAAAELLVSLVVTHAHAGEDPSTRYAPPAATTMMTMTIPANTVRLSALRRSKGLEQDIHGQVREG